MTTRRKQLRILPIPKDLSGTRLRKLCKGNLSLVPSHHQTDEEHLFLGLSFSPPDEIAGFCFDCSRIRTANAGGLCELISLVHWLKARSHGGFTIELSHTESLSKFNLDENLSPIRDPIKSDLSDILLPPVCITFPPAYAVTTEEGKNARRRLLNMADQLVAGIEQTAEVLREYAALRTTVAELIYEGLLNAYEHAYPKSIPREMRKAWVAATIRTIPKGYHSTRKSDREWLSIHAEAGATKILEIAVADAGHGVPATLGHAYQQKHPNAPSPRSANISNFAEDVLKFAFDPYATRKTENDFENNYVRRMWRGLYRVLRRTRLVNGLVQLRSGPGIYGIASALGKSLEMRSETVSEGTSNSWPPGTTLCFRVPIPFKSPEPRVGYSSGGRELVLNPNRVTFIPPKLWKEDTAGESAITSMQIYAASSGEYLHNTVGEALDLVHGDDLEFVVVHPALHFRYAPGSATQTREREQIWSAIIGMMAESTIPGLLPVHCFLEVPGQDILFGQELFSSWISQTSDPDERLYLDPLICGLSDPTDGRIHWFIHSEDDSQATKLAQVRVISQSSAEKMPAWWGQLKAGYSEVVTIQETDDRRELRVDLPNHLSPSATRNALSELLPLLAPIIHDSLRI